jgi:hypothetical protein
MNKLHEALAHLKTAAKSLETALAREEAKKRYQQAQKAHNGQAVSFSAFVKAHAEWMRVNFG